MIPGMFAYKTIPLALSEIYFNAKMIRHQWIYNSSNIQKWFNCYFCYVCFGGWCCSTYVYLPQTIICCNTYFEVS